MRNQLDIAREKLSGQLLEDFKHEITGDQIDRVVGCNPEERFFVGKLMSLYEDDGVNSAFSSKTFICSMGVDFYIDENEIFHARVAIFPQGDLYYRVYPSLQEQREAMLKSVLVSTNITYSSYYELIHAYDNNPSDFKNTEIKLIPVYNKVSLSKGDFNIIVNLNDVYDPKQEYGFMDEKSSENEILMEHVKALMEEAQLDENFYQFQVKEKIRIQDLRDEKTYKEFINKNAKKDVRIHQSWDVYIELSVRKIKGKYLVSTSLVNNSRLFSGKSIHKEKDKITIETLFNSGLRIQLSGANYADISMDFFADDYKYDRKQKAIGTNCTIVYDDALKIIQTEHLPVYTQYRYVTNDKLAVKFDDLILEPIKELNKIKSSMIKELDSWNAYKAKIYKTLSDVGKQSIDREISEFELEMERFKKGIETLKNHPIVLKSFILMNQTFKNSSEKYNTWRLFQIVFIVSIIPDIVACDENIMTEEEKRKTSLDAMALLYFPTGGGKTEAFLGILVFNLFFDRYRGKSQGVTSILRYPLRLLSVQQVQRLANILAQAELLRRDSIDIVETEVFSLGYFVGDSNTPNKLSKDDVLKYTNMLPEQRDEHRIIDICPFCRQNTVHLDIDEKNHRLIHYCENPDCKSGKVLPLYMVDCEIYRYLPSAIISTVDKLAIMGNNRNFRAIINGAEHKCPIHGYTSTNKCVESSICNIEVNDFMDVDMYDPAPTLLIQDELHLINESLGAYASHYESFLHYYIKKVSKSHRSVKVIGATATISSYKSQVYHLYRKDAIRFPTESPYVDKNFYAYTDKKDIQRRIMGYSPFGKAIMNSIVYSLKYMRKVVYRYLDNPSLVLDIPEIGIDTIEDAKKILEDYWIFLQYNNVKRDSNNVEGALETPINVELRAEGMIPFKTRKMTGDESFQDVRNVLAEVENSSNVFEGVNLISATSMISHGVDADRFNNMFFYGIPGNMAEYIQAYSRTGRRYSSIVIDVMRPSRETDQSYLKNFIKMHEFKDILVEAVAINRWATKAIDHTLPGIFVSFLLNKYDLELQFSIGNLFAMKNIKAAISKGVIPKDEVKNMLYEAYGCSEDGMIVDLGNQYREKINNFIEDVYEKILDKNWTEEYIFDGFKQMGYHIMNSLRDTDTPLIIELE